MAEKRNLFQRLLRIEPGIALGQWIYDRIVNNWVLLTAVFGGSLMSALAAVSEFLKPYGPFGIGVVALFFILLIWVVVSWITLIRAKAGVKRVEASAIEKWKQQVDGINPLESQFNRLRIKILDLVHPVTNRVTGKNFIDCELFGPANIYLLGSGRVLDVAFNNCDVIVVRPSRPVLMQTVIAFDNVRISGGSIWQCTIFIDQSYVEHFKSMGANFISLAGDPEIDSPPQQDTGSGTQP